ncbi:MAG: NnrU family protein [Hoeflea sp.]|uniref:NnrU family protein n=1 Tax=Hoeflea sp. TaxID=1940281 RepID=UPI001E14CF4E|nr:NnrU family protein [Hoeflea sp.]MBU4529465.1 NnrU family protein [Alphaproteobacteria bacterium]MBU4546584.1 NnrU family protein [Alphaproteobacteria bacterium]MBU4550852.1 NnrU family protein [Alphaproteobacteria bacterium]MBV1723794.1 NnrU family protein [Hoeflea sp.]MBV1763071.1 NnrU family protein [Hoeflea sp.]
MSGWGEFIAAYGAFLASHAIPVRPPVKPFLTARLGKSGFSLAYSLLSIAVLVWLIVAAGRAPYAELWPRASWQNHVTLVTMAAACLILALAAFRPNPFSFGGWRNAAFDPARPGIIGWIRHPFLAVLALWAAGHLAPNGDLAHVVLFGGFALFALLGMRLIDRRRKREIGDQQWSRLVDAAKSGRSFAPDASTSGRGVAGLALLAALIWLHPHVIGLDPLTW